MVLEPLSNAWWIDSAATRYIVQNKDMFVEFTEKKVGEHKIYMGNNSYSDVLGIGNCQFSINETSIVLHDVLHNVLYVPSIRRNLISISVLTQKGFEINFRFNTVLIKKESVLVKGVRVNDMYSLPIDNNKSYVSQDFSLLSLTPNPPILQPSNSGRKRQLHNVVLPTSNPKISESKRAKHPSTFLKDHYVFQVEELNNLVDDPTSYNEAISNSDATQWLEAMNEELDSIKKNDVWELTDLSHGRKAIDCKWVLRNKFKVDGSLEKYKARILMAVVARMDLELHQLDVKTAFLNGELKEEIYMMQSDGF
ncbi:uncharacterized protein LOC114297141 [Camellia sinensis]|uniref:uncharacterized protein LOC114297141 n=1 Tax=Camellia sinensis TaxID=4442 RepID=UPI00103580E0|nr:uncharacterized protein LOC114297141 [Camellia sinensis]